MKNRLELVHMGFIKPMLDGLKESGMPTGKLFSQSGLDVFRLDDLDTHIPFHSLGLLYEQLEKKETGPELPLEFIEQYSMSKMGDWASFIMSHDDVYDAIIAASKSEARSFTFERMGLRLHGNTALIYMNFEIEKDFKRNWIETKSLHLLVDGLRSASTKSWFPLEVYVSGNSLFGYEDILYENGVKVRFGKPCAGIVVDTSFLFRPLNFSDNFTSSFILPNDNFSHLVEVVVGATKAGVTPSIEKISSVTNIGIRSIQRYLGEENTDFRTVVDTWRMKLALQTLSDPSIPIKHISEICRYSEPSHFNRAFRRWTGISPTQYREGLFST